MVDEQVSYQNLFSITPISTKSDASLQDILSSCDEHILSEQLIYRPTRQNLLACYQNQGWLNDEVINAYLNLLSNYARTAKIRVSVFNSYFFSKLREEGPGPVCSWSTIDKTRDTDLLLLDVILIPVHIASHWMLIVVRPQTGIIEWYDSLSRCGFQDDVERVRKWLDSKFKGMNTRDWVIKCPTSPKQDNGSDCGVFVLTSARFLVLGQSLNYNQSDIPNMRKRIVAEIINGECIE